MKSIAAKRDQVKTRPFPDEIPPEGGVIEYGDINRLWACWLCKPTGSSGWHVRSSTTVGSSEGRGVAERAKLVLGLSAQECGAY